MKRRKNKKKELERTDDTTNTDTTNTIYSIDTIDTIHAIHTTDATYHIFNFLAPIDCWKKNHTAVRVLGNLDGPCTRWYFVHVD